MNLHSSRVGSSITPPFHELCHFGFLEPQVRELAEGHREREDLGALVQNGSRARGDEARVDVDARGVLDLFVLAQRNGHHRPGARDVGASVLDVEHRQRGRQRPAVRRDRQRQRPVRGR